MEGGREDRSGSRGRGWLGRAGSEVEIVPVSSRGWGAPARPQTGPARRVPGFATVGSRESGTPCG